MQNRRIAAAAVVSALGLVQPVLAQNQNPTAPARSPVLVPLKIDPADAVEAQKVQNRHPPAATESGGFDWIRGRLEIGTRITYFSLDDDEHGVSDPFLGNINKLEDDQNLAPVKIFADFMFTPYLGLELTWDQIEATSKNFNNDLSDGTLEASGPILMVLARYPNETGFIPYGGVGVALISGDFSEESWWGLGYDSPATYASLGKPGTPRNGYTREIDVDDDAALVVSGGLLYRFAESWGIDAFLRYMDAEVDAAFKGKINGDLVSQRDGSFPLTNWTFGLGIRYIF